MSTDPTIEDIAIVEPVDPPTIDIAPKRKRGRPPGSLNKKTIAKQSMTDAPAKHVSDTDVQPKTTRPKKTRQPSCSDGSSVEQLEDHSPAVFVKRRKKKRVVVVEESESSSPSPIVVKRKKQSTRQSPTAPQEPIVAPIEQLGKTLRDAQLDRMVAQHQRYNGYFARLCK